MRIELRHKRDKDGFLVPRALLFVAEKPEESLLLDCLGSEVGEDGFIAKVSGALKLSCGYGEHYVELKCPKGKWPPGLSPEPHPTPQQGDEA